MKYLKTGSLLDFGGSKGFYINPYGRIVTNSTNSLKVPTGTTAQRPGTNELSDGMIRYNTTLNLLEVYMFNKWEVLRRPSELTISKQTISGYTGETKFGPLSEVPATINNILVIVENIVQIGTTNFVLVTNPGGSSPSRGNGAYPPGTYIQFTDGDSVPTGIDITVYYGFDL